MPLIYAVEAWSVSGDEEPCVEEMVESEEYVTEESAMRWCWERMEDGHATRMHRREATPPQ